jgi:hypothetical protein
MRRWITLGTLPRFRHSAWTHNNNLFTFGGFEHSSPGSSVANLIELNLTNVLASIINPESSHTEEYKADYEGREFQMSPFVHIAMSYSPNVPTEVQETTNTVLLNNLQEEGRKLLLTKPILYMNDWGAVKLKDPKQMLAQSVIAQLLKPKDWCLNKIDTVFPIKSSHIIQLIKDCLDIIKEQPMICKVRALVKAFGDIHVQYNDLICGEDLWNVLLVVTSKALTTFS